MQTESITEGTMSDPILDLISKVGAQETALQKRTFIAPIFNNQVVATRVEGILYKFDIPKHEAGWYKIKAVNAKRAKIAGKADLMEIEQYLKCLGKIRLVLVMKNAGVYLAVPDKENRYRLPQQEPVPVFLTDDQVADFDRIIARYDGSNFWYEGVDPVNDPSKAEYLRKSLETLVDPSKIRYTGLTFEEKLAYSLRLSLDKKLVEDRKRGTLEGDIEHAGGKLVRFAEKTDHYSVTYTVDGETFTSHVSKDPQHKVIAAGICLSGNDRKFDLKSLITVMREAKQRRRVNRFNIEDPNFVDPHAHDHDYDDDDY